MQRDRAVRNAPKRGLAPWQLRRACQLLLSASCNECRVATLAAACGLSGSHFAHAFKKSTGVPPHRWLLLRRVERAREMMERTGESLSAIALSCGFSDQSHFTRAFGAVMGRSPAVWRRERRSGVTTAEIEGGAIA